MERFKELIKNQINNSKMFLNLVENGFIEADNKMLANYTLNMEPKYVWISLYIDNPPKSKESTLFIRHGLMNEGMEQLPVNMNSYENAIKFDIDECKLTPKIWNIIRKIKVFHKEYNEVEFVNQYDYSSTTISGGVFNINKIYLPIIDVNFPCALLIWDTDDLIEIFDNLYIFRYFKVKGNKDYDKINYHNWKCTWNEIYFHDPNFINNKIYKLDILSESIELGFKIFNWKFIEKMKNIGLGNECFKWFNIIFHNNYFLIPINGV